MDYLAATPRHREDICHLMRGRVIHDGSSMVSAPLYQASKRRKEVNEGSSKTEAPQSTAVRRSH